MTISKAEVQKIIANTLGLPKIRQSEQNRIHFETLEVLALLRINQEKTNCTCIDTRHSNHCPVHYLIDEVIPLEPPSGVWIPHKEEDKFDLLFQ